ncbi:FAD-dependent monooxygenase [Herbidospora mongoliensis]|uniref:FAD-dependent monooxygenase n=1 Tax=Herbidospora mongoliensis TaxID=688067 RepID=UPI0008327682|nr:FAD-dependent monooxygenase [Herbidospora mongoliensis]
MANTLIAGGGIGGLAAALSIAREGNRVTVLERGDRFAELGAGIQLAPNAFRALDLLGVGDQVRERAVFIDELRFMDGTTGHRVAGLPLTGTYRERFGNPYAVVARGDLYQPLLDACRADSRIELLPGQAVTGYELSQDHGVTGCGQAPGKVLALTEDGPFEADFLIGADGIRSAVRARMVGDGRPRVSGHTIYRSVIPMDRVPEELRWNVVTLWAGPKWHFVHYPIGGGAFLNLAATRDDGATREVAGEPVARDHVQNEFPDLSDTARALLALGDEWRTWVLCDRDPVNTWTDGRVALLGDAAHPMLQYAAQGACTALEDAVVLGGVFPDLDTYAELRRERTAKATRAARWLGEQLYHPAGDAARNRNSMLAGLSEQDLHDHVAWLHAYNTERIPSDAVR